MNPTEAIERLKARGLTDADIAALVGARQSTICRIRNGERGASDELRRKLVKLARRLDRKTRGIE